MRAVITDLEFDRPTCFHDVFAPNSEHRRTKSLCIVTGQRTEAAIPRNYGARDLVRAIRLAVK